MSSISLLTEVTTVDELLLLIISCSVDKLNQNYPSKIIQIRLKICPGMFTIYSVCYTDTQKTVMSSLSKTEIRKIAWSAMQNYYRHKDLKKSADRYRLNCINLNIWWSWAVHLNLKHVCPKSLIIWRLRTIPISILSQTNYNQYSTGIDIMSQNIFICEY